MLDPEDDVNTAIGGVNSPACVRMKRKHASQELRKAIPMQIHRAVACLISAIVLAGWRPAGRSTSRSPRSIRRRVIDRISCYRSARTTTCTRSSCSRSPAGALGPRRSRMACWGSFCVGAQNRHRWSAPPTDRRSRHDHQCVGGKFHRARVRALWRAAVLRVRGTLPQARRAGRAAVARTLNPYYWNRFIGGSTRHSEAIRGDAAFFFCVVYFVQLRLARSRRCATCSGTGFSNIH